MIRLSSVRALTLLFLTLFLRVSFGQTNCPPEFAPPKPEQFKVFQKNAKDHGFLWKVMKEGKTSHVYGTIHIGKLEWMFPGPLVMEALRKSQKLALELNMDDPEVRKVMMDLVFSKSESNISNELNERIKRYAESNCIKYEVLEKLRPEMQILTLEGLSLRKEKIYPELGIDTTLRGIAGAMKKTVIGIETAQEQMNLIFSKPEELEKDVILDAYLGTFSSKQIPIKLIFTEENDVLVGTATGQQSIILEPAGKDRFTYAAYGIELQFNETKTEVTLRQGGEILFTREK